MRGKGVERGVIQASAKSISITGLEGCYARKKSEINAAAPIKQAIKVRKKS